MSQNIPRLRIVNTSGAACTTKIYIDDHDVSSAFNGFTVKAGLYGGVAVQLDAPIAELELEGDATELELPRPETRELLLKHGWTPPEGDI
jgi:hypothetical protein